MVQPLSLFLFLCLFVLNCIYLFSVWRKQDKMRPEPHHYGRIAYIDFKEGAEKAYDLNGTEFGGWNILVDEAKPRDSSGGGFSGGGGGHFSGGGGRFGGGGSSGGGRGRDNGGGRGFSKPSYIPSGKKTTFDD
uniref:RRM domain-containing protein n=1 Tax=Brassica oleracea var. oleracea TaxID=109376 RepID=A0A0D3DLI2_BRAOL